MNLAKKIPFGIPCALALASLTVTMPAFALDEDGESVANVSDVSSERGYLGALLGGAMPTATNANTNGAAGGTVGVKLSNDVGLGVMGLWYGESSEQSFLGLPVGTQSSTFFLGLQANLFLGGFHIGGEVGPAISSWEGNVSSIHAGTSETSLAYGPHAGFDFRLSKAVSLGAEAHYLFTEAEGGNDSVQALAALKIWQ